MNRRQRALQLLRRLWRFPVTAARRSRRSWTSWSRTRRLRKAELVAQLLLPMLVEELAKHQRLLLPELTEQTERVLQPLHQQMLLLPEKAELQPALTEQTELLLELLQAMQPRPEKDLAQRLGLLPPPT